MTPDYDHCFRDTEVKLYQTRYPSSDPALAGESSVVVVLRHSIAKVLVRPGAISRLLKVPASLEPQSGLLIMPIS